ncbi:MAG: serine protease, partial [Acidobacteria bacterium]|nr:serine protease [Acidobacteriota bacterium]
GNNSLSALYWARVRAVPVVVSKDGTGSSVVIIVDTSSQKRHAWVVTNYHVVDDPFIPKDNPKQHFVFLLFYDDTLKNGYFSSDNFAQCWGPSGKQTDWCQGVRNSTRAAWVVATDPSRDLALLSVYDPPPGVTGIQPERIETLQPGDPVAVIGNPKGLLWSLTTGSISQVRTNFPLGTGVGTMVQTQAPVNPGNSGGPLLGPDGNLAGVVYGARVGQMIEVAGEKIQVPAEGLNYAIGVDQVLIFTHGHL